MIIIDFILIFANKKKVQYIQNNKKVRLHSLSYIFNLIICQIGNVGNDAK